jgi:hypothetical protein
MFNHSNTVASWCHRTKPEIRGYDETLWEAEQHPTAVCQMSKGSVRVVFTTVSLRPDLVRVSATNWRAEDEPMGWYRRDDAVQLYQAILRDEFQKEA